MLRQSVTYKLASISEDTITPSARLFISRFGVDVHHLRILRLIDDKPGSTFTELADETKFERSATSRSLGRLIKAGLVQRKNDGRDARRFRLFTTAKGKALRDRADPVSLEMERLLLQVLEPAERHAFLATIEKLSAWLSKGYQDAVFSKFPDAAPVHVSARAIKPKERVKSPRKATAA